MRLRVGAAVAYPPHGVGRIAARETQKVLGTKQEVIVLELADGLSVTLPLELAREQLRPLVTEAGLRKIQATLRDGSAVTDDVWSKRVKEAQDKLRGGDPIDLAEIVRDGARREQGVDGGPKLSVSEKALCTKARGLLSREIGLVRKVDRDEADAWIDEQLAKAR